MSTMTKAGSIGHTPGDSLAVWPWRVSRLDSRTVLIGLGTAVYAVILLLSIAALSAPPRISISLAVPAMGQARIVWLLPGGSLWGDGVQPGDWVLALNGLPPRPRDAGTWVGSQVQVRTNAGATLTAVARNLPNGTDTWPLLLLSPWFLLLGTLVFLRARQPGVGWATYVLFAGAALAFAITPATYMDEPAAAMGEFALVLLFAAAFVHFFLIFPAPRGSRRLRLAAVAPPLLLAPWSVAAFAWPALYDPISLLRLVLLLYALCLGLGLLFHALVTERDSSVRRGLAMISGGTLVGILPFVGLYLVPTMLGRPPLLAPELAILALALMPASFAYAILRHHTLQTPLLQRWLVHGVLWLGLIAGYTAPTYVVRELAASLLPEPARSLVLTALLVVLINVSFRQLHDRLWRWIDRRIFKDRYDYRAAMQGLSRDLSRAGDLGVLSTSLADTLRGLMNLKFVVLLIPEQGTLRAHGGEGAYPPAILPALATAALSVRDEPRIVPGDSGSPDVLLAPLRTRDEVVGHLCLGPKRSGEPFRAADKALLVTLSGHLAAMVRNGQLVDDLQAKVAALDTLNETLQRVREVERVCLVADIHDEPLQTAIHLHRQLVAAERANPREPTNAPLSRTLVNQLRAICTAIRPPTLDDLGLSAALDLLAQDLGGRAGVPILLGVDPDLDDGALPSAVDLVLYRGAQEALNNSLRHAHPTVIRMSLRREAGRLCLSVTDDGRGFIVPSHLDSLVTEGHLGLAGLRARVQRAGGRLLVASTPGAGTVLRVEFPLKAVA